MSAASQRIVALAEQFLARNGDGYAVLRVRTPDGDSLRAVGVLAAVPIGAECELIGRYEFHRVYGRQFSVLSVHVRGPVSTAGIERFLAGGWLKGVGPKTARRLVDHFGVGTLDALADGAERIAQTPGISEKKARQIAEAFLERQDIAQLGAFLREHDLPAHLAEKLARTYGGGGPALRVLKTNPFQVAQEIKGVGFRTADALARATGIQPRAPERIEAALLHVLGQAEEEGHMFLPYGEWLSRAGELLDFPGEDAGEVAQRLAGRGGVIVTPRAPGDEGLAVYGAAMYRIETRIVERFREFVQGAAEGPGWDFADGGLPREDHSDRGRADRGPTDEIRRGDETRLLEGLNEQQRAAVSAVFRNPAVVLTGGPGTGKTTAVRSVVEIALGRGLRPILAAPTGRAAKRLAESSGHAATTMHRALEVGQSPAGGHGFGRNRGRPMVGDLFIVDEASMVDAPLFAHWLEALPRGARLLLVGDPEQLPSVGPGQVLRDVIASGVVPVFALSFVFRQSEHSAIVAAAHDVRAGRRPHIPGASDYFFIAEEDPEKTAELVAELAVERLPKYLGVDPESGVQVLTPMKKGICGSDRLNARLGERLGRADGPALRVGPGRVFHMRDKVMNMKNDYELDIYNGDIGVVTQVEANGLRVRFGVGEEAKEVGMGRSQCGSLTHAYAISVHKSQGSEYPCVVIPVVREHSVMLYRQLLYTAMTRAKAMLVLAGSASAFSRAVRKADTLRRYSLLSSRLAGLKTEPGGNGTAQPGPEREAIHPEGGA